MQEKILRLPAVAEKAGISRSAIYLGIANGDFPRPIKLSKRSVGWTESSINIWIEQRIKQSQQEFSCEE